MKLGWTKIIIIFESVFLIYILMNSFLQIRRNSKAVESEKVKSESAEENKKSDDYIKWVDFNVSYEALCAAYEYDVETYGDENHIEWISLLAYGAARTGGEFTKETLKIFSEAKERICENDETMEDLTADLKSYNYYLEVYDAVLHEYLGEYNTVKSETFLSAKGNEGKNEENVEKSWRRQRFFVKKQVETDVFEGQERDGRRRGRKDRGGWRKDRRRTFPDYNPYTIRRCRDCGMNSGKGKLAFVPENELCEACRLVRAQKCENIGAGERIMKYDEKSWERTYISPKDNGLVATQRERIAESKASNSERQKFVKEMRMCKVLADNGHDVEYLRGMNRPVGQTYDICMDGIKADLKCITGGAGNIVKYAKKALTKQGGEAVVLEFPNSPGVEFYEALAEARRKCKGRIFFYIFGDNILKEVK